MMEDARSTWMAGTLALLAAAAAPLAAQEAEEARDAGDDASAAHAVTEEAVWDVVAEKADAAASEREAIRAVLDRPEVEDVARSRGIDLARARDGVATLEGEELSLVAERARQLEEGLVGGDDTIVISTTTIIIALLVLIIILVA